MSDAIRERLAEIVGADGVSTWVEPGGRELPLAVPRDTDAATELVRFAGADRLALVPFGLGTKAGWCSPAEHADFALSTRALSGILTYEPGDGTVSARAGSRMADLAATVREGGHRLVPEVTRPAEATLGGVVAAGASGARRLRFGPARNHVLGVRALMADGTLAKSGGQLVKNVTGYDLHRLYCGSHGTLCVLLEVSLRLFALAERELAFTGETTELEVALAACRRLGEVALAPEVAAVVGRGDAWRVTAAFSGRAPSLEAHTGEVRDALGELSLVTELEGAAAEAAVATVRDAELAPEGSWPTLRLAATRSKLAGATELLLSAASELGAPPPRILTHPLVATLDARLDGDGADDLARELATVLAASGVHARWPGLPHDLRRELELDPPAGLAMMRRLKDSLDPDGVFARGRTRGGI